MQEWECQLYYLARNIKNGFRLAGLQRVKLWDFRYGKWQAPLLLILVVLLSVAIDYLITGWGAEFNRYGVSDFIVIWALSFVGYFLVGLYLGYVRTSKYIVIALAVSIPVALVSGLYEAVVRSDYLVSLYTANNETTRMVAGYLPSLLYLVLLIWLVVIVYRTIMVAYPDNRIRGWISATVYIVFILVGSVLLTNQQELFWEPRNENEGASPYQDIDTERVYYRQQELMGEISDQLRNGVLGVSDLYLITFASYGYQEVFKKEIEYVKEKVTDRYQSQGKTIELLNHHSTVDTVPLANAPNLQRAVQEVGKKMSQEEDVLMMYLTSHGSKNAELDADMWKIEPNPINAIALRQILDSAKIKWRIIIISACYSGGFIEYLKDEYTVVITASSAENTSFGCSNDRELTYFGEAMFDHAWSQSRSFLETFEIAKKWVTEKEISEDKTPSDPQIFIGGKMKTFLSDFESAY